MSVYYYLDKYANVLSTNRVNTKNKLKGFLSQIKNILILYDKSQTIFLDF